MEPMVRKLLPRVQPAVVHDQQPAAVAVRSNGNGIRAVRHDIADSKPIEWRAATLEEPTGQKRKRYETDDRQHRQPATPLPLPGVQHLLTAQPEVRNSFASRTGHSRLISTNDDVYIHEGAFRFLSPPPQLDFPSSIFEDPRPLGFATIDPDLMAVFRRAWYLRQYVRFKQLRGETWLDHIFFNDCFGVENALYTWTSRYEPGMVQYPISKLHHKCLWILFNRSVQASQPSPAYAQVVEHGLHYVRAIEHALGSSGDRTILLLPLFLLGVSAFYNDQRRMIWDALDRLDPSFTDASVYHAAKSLEKIWAMMDDGHVTATWEWEKHHAIDYSGTVKNKTLVDFLMDPLAPFTQSMQQRSPDEQKSNAATHRSALIPSQQQRFFRDHSTPAGLPMEYPESQRQADACTPPQRNHSIVSVGVSDCTATNASTNTQHQQPLENASSPAVVLPPPHTPQPVPNSVTPQYRELQASPQQPNLQQTASINDSIQVLHRRATKSKSHVPPCPSCGKELKNPSDAQKHQLQHSKPFRCHEANCTRAQGFATENDLQRHRKSVHGASPRIGNKVGYVCAACPDPCDGTSRKWWPRLDNFKAHVRRKHQERDEEDLIVQSATVNRPHDASYADSAYSSSSASMNLRWSGDHDASSQRESTYDFPRSHSHSRAGEGGSYDATLRDSPENEDANGAHGEEQHQRDGHDDHDEFPAVNGDYRDESGENGNARQREAETDETDRSRYIEGAEKKDSKVGLHPDRMETEALNENGSTAAEGGEKAEIDAEGIALR